MENKKKHRRRGAARQIMTALLATMPTFTYGIQIGWLSPMGPVLKSAHTPAPSPLTPGAVSWLAAALPLAAILGIPFFSYTTDVKGRKNCIVMISLLSCISWSIKLFYVTASSLIVARVIAGLAAGGCFVVIPAYIKEISEDSLRGALASLTMTVCKVGVIFVYVIGMVTSYSGNQIVYLVVAASHAIVFCFMPESPNYLLRVGREKEAIKTLSWLRGVPRSDALVTDEVSRLREEQRQYHQLPEVTLAQWAQTVGSVCFTFVRDRATFAAVRMTLTLMGMQTLSGAFALMNFAADVFKRAGAQWDPNTLAIFMGSLQLAGSFFTTMSIEKFGRKPPLASSSLVMAVCMVTLATCFLVEVTASWPRVAAVCIAVLAYGVGLAPVPMVIMAEVFAYQFRAKMAGVSMAFSFFCSSMTVLFYTPIANEFGEFVVFYIFGGVALFGVVYTVFYVPETKGKNLQQIQEYWKKETEPVFV